MTYRSTFTFLFIITSAIAGIQRTTNADTYQESVENNAATVIDTALRNLTATQELAKIRAQFDKYYAQNPLTAVGQGGINGTYPVLAYSPDNLGQTYTLTYSFLNGVTRQPTDAPFTVSGVLYEGLLMPPTLDRSQLTYDFIVAHLTVIGTSFDTAHDFSLPFALQGFEPMFLSFPLDSSGNIIQGVGTAGFVNMVEVPEPSALFLSLLGLAGASISLVYGRAKSRTSPTARPGPAVRCWPASGRWRGMGQPW